MNSLTITQTKANGIVEGPVSNLIITKLYNIGKDDDEHQTLTVGVDTTDENRPVSTVSGRIRVNSAFANQLEYLAVKFPDLEINADSTYIYFEDPEVERVLLAASIGDGVGITASDAANANIGTIFKNNTTITSFNTFGYFNRANTSPTNEMFRGCTNLENIDLSNVTRFSNRLFQNTNIADVNAPNLVSSDAAVFTSCPSLQSVTSLGNLASIPDSMFWECANLQTVNLPDNCTTISGSAFIIWDSSTGSLLQVNGIEHVSSFGYRCFLKQKMLRLTANDLANAVSISEKAFLNVLVSSINSPKLMTLGEISFADNSALTTIECLGKVSNIPSSCFGNDPSLLTVKIPYECTSIDTNAFLLDSSLTSIKQYTDSIDDWVEGEEPTTGPLSRVTSFGNKCFYDCSLLLLTQLDIQNATTIGNEAFRNTLLSGPIDLSNVSSIGERSFRKTKITSVNLGPNITSLPMDCFYECTNLSHIYGLENVTYIGETFAGHSGVFSGMDVLHFDNVTSCNSGIADYQAWNTYLCHMYFPKLTTMPGSYSSNSQYHDGFFTKKGGFGCSFVYFRDISVVKPGTFSYAYIKSFVINNTTPPTVTGIEAGDSDRLLDRIFHDSQIENIYVPDASISAYQNSDFLSSYLLNGYTENNVQKYPQLRGMSELTHYATEADWVAAGKPVDGIIDAYM